MGLLSNLLQMLRPAPVASIEPATLIARLRASPAPAVVDVRGPDEFAGPLGHIKGAVNMPLQTLLSAPADRLPRGPLVLVCRTDMRSSMAARHLAKAGVADVQVLSGGMSNWQAQGLPTA